MNQPIRVSDPATAPLLPPRVSAAGRNQWDPVTFAAHILRRSNRLRGAIDLLPDPQPTKPIRKRAGKRARR